MELNSLFELSRQNCVAICAFLVPANLLATCQILLLLLLQRPFLQIRLAAALASLLAIALFLHIATWFIIGVVKPETFILFGLGSTCLVINFLAIFAWEKSVKFLRIIKEIFLNRIVRKSYKLS
jgi:hypothetical protein